MGKAPLYLNGSKLSDIGEGDARNRFAKASQALISFSYPNLRMLKGAYDETTLSNTLLDPSDLLAGTQQELSEAEQEILTYVLRNQNNGERTSVEEIVRQFGRRPYGWYPMAVLTLIARLFRMGKVELRGTDLLDARTALGVLKNSRQHGGIRVRMQEQFDAGKVNAVKRFHQDFFDRVNEANDPRSVGQLTLEALAGEARDLQLLIDQSSRYSFLAQLQPVTTRIKALSEKDYSYILNHLAEFSDELLESKDDLIGPIKSFMHGAQRKTYDEVLAFYREEEANFSEIPVAELEPLRQLTESQAPFRGSILPQAKTVTTKLRGLIDERLEVERNSGLASLATHEAKLVAMPEFERLSEVQRAEVLQSTSQARQAMESARFITAIRDRISRYTGQDYPAQLALATRLNDPVMPTQGKPGEKETPPPATVLYTPATSLRPLCTLPYIATEADLDQWLGALRSAAVKELKSGKRISL